MVVCGFASGLGGVVTASGVPQGAVLAPVVFAVFAEINVGLIISTVKFLPTTRGLG